MTLSASACTLSGTPAEVRAATEYTFTASDADGDEATLTFTIEVEAPPLDDASFVRYADVPSKMAAGSSATVTVRMRNTGTTTWTSSDGYQLGSQRPEDDSAWGLSRVPVPSDVAPGGEVDFTFEVTAPETVGRRGFRWRMVRGAGGWFGDETELREITVEDPSFGDAAVPDQMWVKNEPVEPLTLPEASGSGGALTYALTPALPEGLTFTESTRTVSGTPTALREATDYTYTATDIGGDAASLVFSVEVEEASVDDASFVSVAGVPSKMAAGGTATVTVTMRNAGTTTWTPAADYGLGSQQNSDTWGVKRAPLSGSVAPNENFDFTFTITAPETVGAYTFAWRMARGPAGWFGTGTGDLPITVEDPSFGDAEIADQRWVRDEALEALTLPAASGGDGGLTYALTPALPDGVSFSATTRVLSGTPAAAQSATEYTYSATDEAGDWATLAFSITVEAASVDDASFVSVAGVPSKMAAGGTAAVTVTMRNTGTTTWTPAAGYGLGSPQNSDTWGVKRAPLSGSVAPNEDFDFTFTITAPETVGAYTFAWRMARGPAGWFGTGTGDLPITVTEATSPAQESTAPGPDVGVGEEDVGASARAGVFDMFEYWLLPHGRAMTVQTRLRDGSVASPGGLPAVRSFWRGDLWGRRVALLGDPGGERYDIFEEVEGGLDYWGAFEGAAAGGEDRPSASLDRPFRWMNRFMAVGDAVESAVTRRLLSGRRRNQEGVADAAMCLEVLAHRASFDVPAVEGLTFEDVLVVRFWPDAARPEAHDTFYLARGFGAVYSRRTGVTAPGEVAEWWAVEKALTAVAPSAPSVPWFDPFSPGWPKTAVLNGAMEDAASRPPGGPAAGREALASGGDLASGVDGARVGGAAVPGWTADSGDAVLGRTPSGLAGGAWSLLLRGSGGGGDGAADAATTEAWIPVEGGTYQLSACMRRENPADTVLVDFDDGKGRDADFADGHLVAASTGTWECRAVTKCIPASVGAVRIRAARDGANLGDAWFDRIELKRIAACTAPPGSFRP